jgi:Capsule polysaccharide biosynthesis protein
MKICVYAFSSLAWFFRGVIKACDDAGDDVEWSAVLPQGHFLDVLSDLIPPQRRCYLYESFNSRYRSVDAADMDSALSAGEGLVTALMKDKGGYRTLSKDEQLRRGAVMHRIYREFLERIRPDYVLCPDIETVDGFALVNVCRQLSIPILYYVGMRIFARGFFSADPYEALPSYFGQYSNEDIGAARDEIRRFSERRSRGPGSEYPPSVPPKVGLLRRVFASEKLRLTKEQLHCAEEGAFLRVKRNIRPLLTKLRCWRFEFNHRKYFDVADERAVLPEQYVFYTLHYTPESSINGLEPYYVDQARVIDALLLSLPPGHRLLVKEHPSMYGLRPRSFYREITRRPGLVLVHPSVDTRELIERANLVATVTGTIGLECFLLGKPCLSFGRNFFSHLCYRPPALGELRTFLQRIIEGFIPTSERDKEVEVAKLLNLGADFVVGDPWLTPSVMSRQNIAAARTYLWRHLARLQENVL